MKIDFHAKYPCGYEVDIKVSSSLFDFFGVRFDDNEYRSCPIHGKDCPPKEQHGDMK